MAISFVGVGTGTNGSTGTCTPGFPSGLAAGDLLMLCWLAGATTTPTVEPSGFTALGQGLNLTVGHGGKSRFYYKVSDGTESGTITCTTSPGVGCTASIVAYRGVDTSSAPVGVVGGENVSDTSMSFGGSLSPATGDVVIGMAGGCVSWGSWTSASITSGSSTYGTYTQQFQRTNGGAQNNQSSIVMADAPCTSGGTGTVTWASTLGTASGKSTGLYVLKAPVVAADVDTGFFSIF